MKWIYWVFLIFFVLILKIAEDHSFILVFFSPFQDLVWVSYPIFSILTIAANFTGSLSKFIEISVKILSVIIGALIILFFNFSILPFFVLFTLSGFAFLYYKKLIRLNISSGLLIICSLIYINQYHTIYKNWLNFSSEGSVSILSYNLGTLDSKQRLQVLSDIIDEHYPDIICLQEILGSDEDSFRKNLNDRYPYQHYSHTRQSNYQGGIVLSKFPYARAEDKRIYNRFKNSSMEMNYVNVEIDSTKYLAIYNIHLISNGLGVRSIFKSKLELNDIVELERNNYIKRLDEARNVIANIDYKDPNIVIIGDFNDIQGSQVLSFFEEHFENAWVQAGKSHLLTFGYDFIHLLHSYVGLPKRYSFNFIGIDNAFVSEKIDTKAFDILDIKYSDHSPILINIDF